MYDPFPIFHNNSTDLAGNTSRKILVAEEVLDPLKFETERRTRTTNEHQSEHTST